MAGWLDGNWSVDWSTRFLIIGQLCLSDLLIKEFSNPHCPIVEKVNLFHYLPLPTEFPTFVKTGKPFWIHGEKNVHYYFKISPNLCTEESGVLLITSSAQVPNCSVALYISSTVFLESDQSICQKWSKVFLHLINWMRPHAWQSLTWSADLPQGSSIWLFKSDTCWSALTFVPQYFLYIINHIHEEQKNTVFLQMSTRLAIHPSCTA